MTAADVVRAIRESASFIPRMVQQRQRAEFGAAIAARVRANRALLDQGATAVASWTTAASGRVPRSFPAWYTLCAAGDVDGVLCALLTFTEFADEMRASHRFVGILNADAVLAIRASVRAVSLAPHACAPSSVIEVSDR